MISKVSQSDWGSGLWRSGNRDRVPENASGELAELLLSEDGLPYERGGATRKTNAATGSTGIAWVVDRTLRAGRRTVYGNPTRIWTLDVDDVTPLAISMTSAAGWSEPVVSVVVDGMLFVEPDSTGVEVLYAGSRKTTYSAGTATFTNGSPVVTGAGTSWLANAEPGMFIGTGGVYAVIESVDSNTQLTLRWEWVAGSGGGLTYLVTPSVTAAVSNPAPVYYGAVANRLVRTNGPYRLDFSQVNEHGAQGAADSHFFTSEIRGFGTLRDVLLVFTTGGVWSLSNMAFPLIDVTGSPQHRQELVNADLILWDRRGVASWSGGLIVPAVDGVWLIDTQSAPQRVSPAVDDLYLGYVRAGHHCGLAEVFNGHYKLPILSSGGAWVDTLVCRLSQTRSGPPFAWSRLRGKDAQVNGFAERSSSNPVLLGAEQASSSRVLDCTAFFSPAGSNKLDADGSTRQAVWESREFALSDMPTTVRRVRVWYELIDAASDNPTVEFSYAKDTDTGYTVVSNSLGTVQGTGTQAGSEGDGTLYSQWPVNKRAKGMRFRLRTLGPNAGFRIRQVELVTEAVQSP